MFTAYKGLVRKELIQIRRDSVMLRVIFLMPIIQLMLLGYAVNTDVKLLAADVYDFDQSRLSREYIQSFKPGDYFVPDERMNVSKDLPVWELDDRFKNGRADLAIIIPEDFSEKLIRGDEVTVGMISDGADANAARAGMGYAAMITNRFNQEQTGFELPIEVRESFLYNPEVESVNYMVPGIVSTLLMMITVMMTAMAIVREREMGTLEQLTVTPISSFSLLMGKISTFGMLGIFEFALALTIGVLWFGIPFVGSPILLLFMAALFLLTTLGLGMYVSTVTSTQQQAMFLAWFFSIFAILTSGFFTPISNMPHWMQYVTLLNPMRYFMEIVRGIMMKGSGLFDLWPHVAALAAYGVLVFSLSMLRFHKRAA